MTGIDDDAALAALGAALAGALGEALPDWVERSIRDRAIVDEAVVRAARREAADVARRVADLLAADVDEQWTNPLHLVRGAVTIPTRVLREAGVPEPSRDEHARSLFPDDPYDLTPASFAEVDPDLHDLGIAWGAAKAHVHLARRRADGTGGGAGAPS